MLDDLELPQVQELATVERRLLAEHKPPGMAGSLLQNMGRRPMRVAVWGVATGPDAQGFVDKLNERFAAGQPLPFVADIVADARLDRVVVEDLRVQDLAGKPERFAYILTLREYIEPLEAEDTSDLDSGILDEGERLTRDMVPGLTTGLDFASGLARFVTPLSSLLTRLQAVNAAVSNQSG